MDYRKLTKTLITQLRMARAEIERLENELENELEYVETRAERARREVRAAQEYAADMARWYDQRETDDWWKRRRAQEDYERAERWGDREGMRRALNKLCG